MSDLSSSVTEEAAHLSAADVVASGVHDVSNMLFAAMTATYSALDTLEQLESCPENLRESLQDSINSMSLASLRLSKTMSTYRLINDQKKATLSPVYVPGLLEFVELCAEPFLKPRPELCLELKCEADEQWMLDRELIGDALNNALQNACRHARSKVLMRAFIDDDGLHLCLEDDGPGFPETKTPHSGNHGLGLVLAELLVRTHRRKGKQGHLRLGPSTELGGARFEMVLP